MKPPVGGITSVNKAKCHNTHPVRSTRHAAGRGELGGLERLPYPYPLYNPPIGEVESNYGLT